MAEEIAVQRVMRALYDTHPTAMPPFKKLPKHIKAIFKRQAEAAIAAMRTGAARRG